MWLLLKNTLLGLSIILSTSFILFLAVNLGAQISLNRDSQALKPHDFWSYLSWPDSGIGRKVYPDAFEGETWREALEYYDMAPGFAMHPILHYRTENVRNVHYRLGLEGIRYEPGWDDGSVRDTLQSRSGLVLLFGGSTTLGHGVAGHQTISAKLNSRFAKEGIPFRSLNFGAQAYDQHREIDKLLYLLRSGVRPQMVVFLDGWNDFFTIARSNMRVGDKVTFHGFISNRGAVAHTPFSLFQPINPLWELVDSLPAIKWLKKKNIVPISLFDIKIGRNSFLDGFDFREAGYVHQFWADYAKIHQAGMKEQLEEYYRNNLSLLAGLSDGFEFKYAVLYQPIGLIAANNPFVGDAARTAKGYDYVQKMDTYVRNLIKQNNLPMLDISDVLKGIPLQPYIDAAHYSPHANRILADKIFDIIVNNQRLE